MNTKACNTCGQRKYATEFRKDSSKRDGRDGRCRDCHNEYNRQWRARKLEQDPDYYNRLRRRKRATQWSKACRVCRKDSAGRRVCSSCYAALELLDWDASRVARAMMFISQEGGVQQR